MHRFIALILDLFSNKGDGTSVGIMTNKDILYGMSIAHLGWDASPNDLAPDELGCAESVNDIYKKAFGKYFYEGNQLSTYWLYKALKESDKFQRVFDPSAGTIVISPTNAHQVGHVGIHGKNGIIMSNNSFRDSDGVKGVWLENYTDDSWQRMFGDRKKLGIYYFDIL